MVDGQGGHEDEWDVDARQDLHPVAAADRRPPLGGRFVVARQVLVSPPGGEPVARSSHGYRASSGTAGWFMVFGSAARGEDTDASDIDLLVRFAPGSSLFVLIHLSDELERILGRRVDVVSEGGLKLRDEHIRAEAVRA
jgi:predicted nucleotidyltransferase